MFKFQIVILAMCVFTISTQASVIRSSGDEEKDAIEVTTVTATLEEMEVTTVQADEEVTTVTPESEVDTDTAALTKDEEASILIIDQTLLDSTSSDLKLSDAESVQVQRSGKLLLLSTAKLSEKSKVPEETPEESEELKDLDVNQTSTDSPVETTTVMEEETTTMEAVKEDNDKPEIPQEELATTKLFPINDTLYEDIKKDAAQDAPEAVVIVDEEPKEMKNSNLAAIVLEEAENDYVLIESDLVEEGPYADIDSDLHLQPIVQSVEIVPSSVDDTLLVNYVHSW